MCMKFQLNHPVQAFLTRSRLKKFREAYRELLNRIHFINMEDAVIHLFPIPAPIALLFGRNFAKSDQGYCGLTMKIKGGCAIG